MEWSFVAVGPVHANLEVPAGRVDVRPAAEAGAPVLVSLEPERPGSRRAEEQIAASRVTFAAGQLEVSVPSRSFKTTGIVCRVDLPPGSSLAVTSASADVSCTGTVADCSVTTASGDVALGDVEGDLRVVTASGDVRCGHVASRLDVKGASSDVRVASVGGRAEIVVASGDVEVGDAAASVQVASRSGDCSVRRAREGEIRVDTASGDITVGVAAGVGAYLDVKTLSGDMSCTLPFDETEPGDAKLRIVCNTASGDIEIMSAAP